MLNNGLGEKGVKAKFRTLNKEKAHTSSLRSDIFIHIQKNITFLV